MTTMIIQFDKEQVHLNLSITVIYYRFLLTVIIINCWWKHKKQKLQNLFPEEEKLFGSNIKAVRDELELYSAVVYF